MFSEELSLPDTTAICIDCGYEFDRPASAWQWLIRCKPCYFKFKSILIGSDRHQMIWTLQKRARELKKDFRINEIYREKSKNQFYIEGTSSGNSIVLIIPYGEEGIKKRYPGHKQSGKLKDKLDRPIYHYNTWQ